MRAVFLLGTGTGAPVPLRALVLDFRVLGTCIPVPSARLKKFQGVPVYKNRAVAMSAAVGHGAAEITGAPN